MISGGYGWVLFAGALLLMLGTLNFIEGLAAIGNSHFFQGRRKLDRRQPPPGAGSFCASACCEWLVDPGSHQAPVVTLGRRGRSSLNAMAQLMMMPAYPFWSLSILMLDILAIYGLIVYGKLIEAKPSVPRNRCVAAESELRYVSTFEKNMNRSADLALTIATRDRRDGAGTQRLVQWRRSAQRSRARGNACRPPRPRSWRARLGPSAASPRGEGVRRSSAQIRACRSGAMRHEQPIRVEQRQGAPRREEPADPELASRDDRRAVASARTARARRGRAGTTSSASGRPGSRRKLMLPSRDWSLCSRATRCWSLFDEPSAHTLPRDVRWSSRDGHRPYVDGCCRATSRRTGLCMSWGRWDQASPPRG